MTTLPAATKAVLTGDGTLVALATGGIHDLHSLGRNELEPGDLQAGVSPVIQPGIFLRWRSQAQMGLRVAETRRGFVEVYFYDHEGYTTIATMRAEVYRLLHQARVLFDEPDRFTRAVFVWAGDVEQQEDDSLMGAAMERSRYEYHVRWTG